MRSLPFEDQWAFVLQHPNERVRRIAERASREPKLRELFPYWSMNNLRFSATSKYPYEPLPYILFREEGDSYEARAADNQPIAEGDLETVVEAIVREIH